MGLKACKFENSGIIECSGGGNHCRVNNNKFEYNQYKLPCNPSIPTDTSLPKLDIISKSFFLIGLNLFSSLWKKS